MELSYSTDRLFKIKSVEKIDFTIKYDTKGIQDWGPFVSMNMFFFCCFFFNENTKLVFSHTHLVWDKFAVREQHHWTDCCITEGLLKSHIRLKHEDKHDQRGAHGIDFKGSFTSQSYIWIPRPDVSWLFMLFFVKCKSLYKYPASFFFFFLISFPFDIFVFLLLFRRKVFVIPSTIHLPHCLVLFLSIYLRVQKDKTSHLCCPAVMTILPSADYTVKFKPQTKPSWRGKEHRNMKHGQQGETRLMLVNICFYSAGDQPIIRAPVRLLRGAGEFWDEAVI